MKNLLIYFFGLLLFTPVSCQKKKDAKKNVEKYEWEEKTSAPLGYPIQVYRGGFSTKEGAFVSLYGGTTTGTKGWGSPRGGMSKNKKTLPDALHVIWLSYAEDAMFEIDADVDKDKIAAYFSKGYDSKVANGTGEIRHYNYTGIVAGFAPGGVVVVWISGPGIQKEIGRYQGRKIIIPQAEINALDYPDKTLFDLDYRQKIFKKSNVVPLDIQNKNKNKPIPLGTWDIYRKKYQWKPVLNLPDKAILDLKGQLHIKFINGEVEEIFSEKFPVKDVDNKAIPKGFSISWIGKDDILYAGNCEFDEESALAAFEKIFGEFPEKVMADIEIRVNISNTFFTVKLKGSNGKEAFIDTSKLEAFKVRQYE